MTAPIPDAEKETLNMPWTLSAFADESGPTADEQVAALVEAQIKYVDLRNVDGINITELPLDHAQRVQKKLEAAGIRVCMYGSPIGKIDIADDHASDIKRLRHLGELKQIFGATYVRMFSYFNKKSGADEATYQAATIDRLQKLIELADKLGLVLFHENELGIFGDTLARVKTLRDLVHRPNPQRFKLIFDFDNFNQMGEKTWETWLALRDDVEAIHLKESKRQADGSFQHVPAGQGDGQILRVLADLAARGWTGPLTLEPHLARSAAVIATGPHGSANAQFANLTTAQTFQVAAEAARKLLKDVDRLG